jgi:hypothetical protein
VVVVDGGCWVEVDAGIVVTTETVSPPGLQNSRPSYTVQSSCCKACASRFAACWLLNSTTTAFEVASKSMRNITVELRTAG